MRLALITALSADRSAVQVIAQPGEPHEVRAAFKNLIADGGAGHAEIHLWESSSGLAARKKFGEEEIGDRAVSFDTAAPITEAEGLAFLTEIERLENLLADQVKLSSVEIARLGALVEEQRTALLAVTAERDKLQASIDEHTAAELARASGGKA